MDNCYHCNRLIKLSSTKWAMVEDKCVCTDCLLRLSTEMRTFRSLSAMIDVSFVFVLVLVIIVIVALTRGDL